MARQPSSCAASDLPLGVHKQVVTLEVPVATASGVQRPQCLRQEAPALFLQQPLLPMIRHKVMAEVWGAWLLSMRRCGVGLLEPVLPIISHIAL